MIFLAQRLDREETVADKEEFVRGVVGLDKYGPIKNLGSECIKVIASYGIRNVIYSDVIDAAVYDLEAIKRLATSCGITLKQEVKE